MKTLCRVLVALALLSPAYGDSLFTQSTEQGGTLIAKEANRFEVGDIITVLVKEVISASTSSDTNTKKESEVEAKAAAASNTFFMKDDDTPGGFGVLSSGDLPNWQTENESESKSRGTTTRKTTLETSITCFVTKVLPNGNIMLEGVKELAVNREDSTLIVSGIARSRDVTAANTIPSAQLANAQVKLKGKGPLWNNQRRGWFTRVLDWISP